ncbi:glycoside hydrolase family 43 protein [Allosphingosinicella sp.]|jgi:beta-xylosidase|uniref:glycoside hydrolase family 43 protein n=1 Tax=Allosphingosinicella sp. TaxID=2823234 RepID=UPI002F066ECD
MPVRRVRRLNRALLAAALLGSTAQAQVEATGPRPCPGDRASLVPARSLGAAGPHLILDENFPDPFVARFEGAFHAYATGNQTGGGQMNVQTIRSSDLTRWTAPVEALPAVNLPAWVDQGHPQVWAPEVNRVGGRYVLYFNARHRILTRTETPPDGPRVHQRHCVGAAVADRPDGPFLGVGGPLACEETPNGAIDANVFADGGSLYLYYKDDGNCCGPGSAIYVQGLSADGLAPVGPRHLLVASNDSPQEHDDWEWRVVEAPTMVRRSGAYYLFYSGNFFGNRNYAVAYLRCATPRGPCSDPGENPILWSHPQSPLVGPGHQSVMDRGRRSYVFFHGWNEDPDARERPGVHKRCLYVSRLYWDGAPGNERPRIAGGEPAEP